LPNQLDLKTESMKIIQSPNLLFKKMQTRSMELRGIKLGQQIEAYFMPEVIHEPLTLTRIPFCSGVLGI
jgi:hypothetical protein